MIRTAFLLIAVSVATAFSAPLKLSDLQRKLQSGFTDETTWQASENWMSQLSREEAKKRLGAILPKNFGENFSGEADDLQDAAAPAKFDWRNVNGVNFGSPILNQGRCGSCVAFAVIGALETQTKITRNTPDGEWTYSPQHLFACGKGTCERGWQPSQAAQYLKTDGVPDEACFPYKSGALGEDQACQASCSNASKRSQKIVNYTMPTFFFSNQAAVKEALQKGPLVTTMVVYEDFLFYKSGVYKHVTGDAVGGHAITIMGWDDNDKAWIVKNSWGEEWGDKGYFKVAYADTSGISSQTWLLEVSKPEGFVTLGVRDYDVLKGMVDLKVTSTLTGTQSVGWTLSKNKLPMDWGFVTDSVVPVDTTKYPDGVYTLEAMAQGSKASAVSQPRTVYVLNGEFTGKLTFTDVSEGQSFNKDAKLHFDVESAPIPFTKVVFHVRNLKTGEDSVRSTGRTFPKMEVGWRATSAPAGDYELQLDGQVGGKVVYSTKPLRVKVVKNR